MADTLDPKKAPPPGVVISSYDELVKQARAYNATLKLSVSQDGIKVCTCLGDHLSHSLPGGDPDWKRKAPIRGKNAFGDSNLWL